MSPTSASQRMANSLAFFSRPFLLLEKVTCLLVELSILRITIFPLPMLNPIDLMIATRSSPAERCASDLPKEIGEKRVIKNKGKATAP